MERYLLLLSIIFILSGCESAREYEYRKEAECNGIWILHRCNNSVAEFCTINTQRSEWSGRRNKEQREAYDVCVQVNSGMFNKL